MKVVKVNSDSRSRASTCATLNLIDVRQEGIIKHLLMASERHPGSPDRYPSFEFIHSEIDTRGFKDSKGIFQAVSLHPGFQIAEPDFFKVEYPSISTTWKLKDTFLGKV